VTLDDGRAVPYPVASLHQLSHAFAISVHKAQGAEFPGVVLPVLTSHAALLGRTLLYTAVTRARQLVVLVGQRRALALAVKDWRRTQRQTALGGLLGGSVRYAWSRPDAVVGSMQGEAGVWEGLLGDEAVG
jgi:exodeoxyribonuclease V alpha subunit